MLTGTHVVSCNGVPALYACGNNALGGAGGDVVNNVPTSTALGVGIGYGVLRRGGDDTGWNATLSSY